MPLARIKYGVESLLDLFRLLAKARGIDMYYVCVFQTTAFDYLVRWSIMFSAVKEVFRISENVFLTPHKAGVCVVAGYSIKV